MPDWEDLSQAPDWARYTRADEFAECVDGVIDVPGLYEALWEIAAKQAPIPNLEDSGPADHVGHENLARYWTELSEDHRREMVRLQAAQDDALGFSSILGGGEW